MNDEIRERGKSFENKFAYDEEIKFKINARRNKLIAEWAAKLMNHNEDATDLYKDEIITKYFAKTDDILADKIFSDLNQAGVHMSKDEIRRQFLNLFVSAKEQLGYIQN